MRKLTALSLSDAMTMCTIFDDEYVAVVCATMDDMTALISGLYDAVRSGMISGSSVTTNGIQFQSGSTIKVFLVGSDALRGQTFTGVLYDERIKDLCDPSVMREVSSFERPKFGTVRHDDDLEENTDAVDQFLSTFKINQE